MLSEFLKIEGKKRDKKINELTEHKIYQIDIILKKELSRGIKLENIDIEDLTKQNLANLVFYIISKDKFYLKVYINVVKYFLDKYTKYNSFEGDKEYFLKKLSMSMYPEKFPKDKIIMKKDQIGDKFYIILKGSVSIIIVQETFAYLTQHEYDKYLENLKYYKEYSLIRLVFTYPNQIKADQNILKDIHEDLLFISNKKNSSNNNDYERISPSEFVERIEPKINRNDINVRIKVKIATYKIVANLKEGDTFGEIALNKNDKEEKRRTATVITNTECMMGTILNNVYSSFLKDVEEKNKLILIGQVLQHTLFKDVSPENFLKYNYFNYFNTINYKGGEYLFKQGEIRNAIYFINDGIINLETESSFEDIDYYILYFKKDLNKYIKKYNKINKNEIDEDFYIDKKYDIQREANSGFDKYYKTKRKMKIYNIQKKETLGYGDCLFTEDTFFASAKVLSHTCQAFVLEINFLVSLLKDHLISSNYSITNFERKQMMIQRLKNIKLTYLDKYLQNNKKTNSVLDTIKIKIQKKNNSINNFKHSSTIINLKQNIKNSEQKYKGIPNEKNIFSLKIKKKYTSKNHLNKIFNIFPTFSLKHKKNMINKNLSLDKKAKINNFCIQKEEELEKYNDKISKSRTIHLKNSLSFNNKKKDALLPSLNRIKNKGKTTENISKTEEKKIINKKINNLISKMTDLSNKYMLDEYGNDKNKNKIKKYKNMTKLDFLFYDYIFTERGNKNYSKKPLISEI